MGFDYRTLTGMGKQTLGGHKQNLVHIKSQEKGVSCEGMGQQQFALSPDNREGRALPINRKLD